MNETNLATALAQLCTLEEPTRRTVYQAVRDDAPASRAQVARVVGISVSLAAFHLDTLVDAGLLEAFYARPPGRGGPGAGRPAKWYQPADVQLAVSVPPRRYELLAAILVEAIQAAAASGKVAPAIRKAARQAAGRLAASSPTSADGPSGWRHALQPLGGEPVEDDGGVVFANCPFAALAGSHPDTVCTANVALVKALLTQAGVTDATVRQRRGAGGCCVLLRGRAR